MKSTETLSEQPNITEFPSPLLELHKAIVEADAYQYIDKRRQKITQAYLTTDATMSDLTNSAEVNQPSSVRYLLTTSMQRIFQHLPLEVQKQYKSPLEALQLKSRAHTLKSRQKISESLTDKIREPFSSDHKSRLSEAARKRWQRIKEEQE